MQGAVDENEVQNLNVCFNQEYVLQEGTFGLMAREWRYRIIINAQMKMLQILYTLSGKVLLKVV